MRSVRRLTEPPKVSQFFFLFDVFKGYSLWFGHSVGGLGGNFQAILCYVLSLSRAISAVKQKYTYIDMEI